MKKLFYIILLSVLIVSCGEDDCSECGTPTSKSLIEVTFDNETHIYKSGDDWGDEKNSYVSGERITYSDDGISAWFYTDPQIPIGEETSNDIKIYFRYPIMKDFVLNSQVQNSPILGFPLIIIEKNNKRYFTTGSSDLMDQEWLFHPNSIFFQMENFSFIINEFTRDFEPSIDRLKGEYSFDMKLNVSDPTIPIETHSISVKFDYKEPNIIGQERSGNSLLGKWYQVPQSCANSSGERNFLHFKVGNKLTAFQADCNSACSGGGVTTEINYEVSGNQIINNPTSVSEYCGVQAATPAPFTATYSISSDETLTIDGQQWRK